MAKQKIETDDDKMFDLFNLDPDRLDEELLHQASYYRKFARQLAVARNEMDQAKAEIDVAFADVDAEVRADPVAFGLERLTEPAIKQIVLGSKEHKLAQKIYYQKKLKAGLLEANVKALEHRKRALSDLVELHGQGYWAADRSKKWRKAEDGSDFKRLAARADKRRHDRNGDDDSDEE